MAFPVTPLNPTVELNLGGTWTDISSYVYARDDSAISISRGRQNEGASNIDPGTLSLTLNNRDGRFSPRNPTGPYFGLIGRNTPIRVSALIGPGRLVSPATLTDYMEAPDTAGLSITGDIDLRVDMRAPNWTQNSGNAVRLLRKFTTTSSQFSWTFNAGTSGLTLFWSADGTTLLSATSTVPLPQTTGRQTVRATLDVDNGASGRTITFYTGLSVDGPWTQLGDPVVQAGVTSIFDSTATVVTSTVVDSEVYALKILQGIGGTERANPNFTAQTEGATSFTDAAGNTWTTRGGAALTARRYRFYGEVSSWPQAWDVSQKDVWVPIEAAGIVRRFNQGAATLPSTIRRAAINDANCRAYWPMEDENGSTSIASGLTGGSSMTITGTPTLSSSTAFPVSEPLPVLANAAFTGAVGAYTASGTIHAHCLFAVPAAGDVDGSVIMRIFTTGTASRWDIVYGASFSGTISVLAYDSLGTLLATSGPVGYAVNGKPAVVTLELTTSGSDIAYSWAAAFTSAPVGSNTGTITGRTVGVATAVQVNPSQTFVNTAVGHVTISSAVATWSSLSVLYGYPGETAGRRVERLCSEQGIAFQAYGDLDQTVAMGAQKAGLTFLDQLSQCEAADLGQVFETRDALGLGYRTRDSRQYQSAALALSYGNLMDLTPVEDDQATRNDITVNRIDGSSARATVDTGSLSTQAPPLGVGRYADSVDLCLYTDTQCGDHASLRATIGTVDEPRYPSIQVHLEAPAFAASSSLTTAALAADCGDLVTITGTPIWLPPGTIRQHTIGQTETLGPFEYEIEFVCVPATPIGSAGVYDGGGAYAGSGSTLTSSITSTATGAAALSITTPAGSPLWTTSAGDFPLDILVGGERITLSAISGTSSPQSATVSARSVNGVVKAQTAGAAIDVADPVYYAL